MQYLRATPLILMLLIGACHQPRHVQEAEAAASGAAPPASPTAPLGTPQNSVAGLSGEWRVAGIDGRGFDEPQGLALTANADELWWEPRCAGMGRKYHIAGQSITFAPLREPVPAGSPTPPVCAIGLPPRLDEVFRALDGAESVTRTPENGILIAGGGHSVTLFSQ